MADEKDRFGETMKLVERAKEDIYFAEHDRELIEKLKAQLQKADKQESQLHCPKCPGLLETHYLGICRWSAALGGRGEGRSPAIGSLNTWRLPSCWGIPRLAPG